MSLGKRLRTRRGGGTVMQGTLLARRRVLCDEMQHALSRVIAVFAAEDVGAVGNTGIDVDLLRSR